MIIILYGSLLAIGIFNNSLPVIYYVTVSELRALYDLLLVIKILYDLCNE